MKILNRPFYSFARIAFVGLGNMGLPMAANLAVKGHQVEGYDVDPNKVEICKGKNVAFKTTVLELAKNHDVFVTMLPNSEHSMQVCDSSEGNPKNTQAFLRTPRRAHWSSTAARSLPW